ncbi:hypothetical protein GCM10007159_31400 [Modicisalibacter luteus]|nr:hypothetical protein GCM10007159_31400 [Halomonas lutea]
MREFFPDLIDGCIVLFHHRQLEQLLVVHQATIQGIDGLDDGLQRGAFLAQLLGIVGIIPDVGVFELAGDFF